MTLPLMPKATAVWLVENTTLNFEQIAEFCGMHILEVQGIADGEVAAGIIGKDPITSNQLTKDEIARCEKSPNGKLKLSSGTEAYIIAKKKQKSGGRYTPIARRHDKPAAVLWLLKHCPDVSDLQVIKLIGTTKNTIASIKSKTHWNFANITAKDPVLLGLCSQNSLDTLVDALKKQREKEEKKAQEEGSKETAAKEVEETAVKSVEASKKKSKKSVG